MTSLFADLSYLSSARARANAAGRIKRRLFAPFQVLHGIQWSAPWEAAPEICGASTGR